MTIKTGLHLFAVATFATGLAVAQVGDAEMAGSVKDPTGAPVPSAKLTLTNQDSGVARSTNSDGDGRYHFAAILPGRYSIKAEATGFRTETVTDMVLNVGTHLDRDVSLSLGNVQDSITVTGEVPLVDASKADVGGVITQAQIDSLPVNTRQTLNLALLMPGTTQDGSRSFYNNVQIGGGGRFYANGFTVDGVTNTWAEQGEPRQNFPQGSIQEFNVILNQARAEQGLFTGGVVNMVTRSGTNQFHGEAFEYWRNAALNHDNQFTEAALTQVGRTGKAPFNRNQFGGDIGGPILKNRVHFYTAYERTEIKDAFTIYTGPAGHAFYGANEGVFDKPSHDQLFTARVDDQISNNQHLFGRYAQEWNLQTWQGCSNSTESNCYDGLIPRKGLVIGHTWTPTSSVVNDFRFQYAYSSYQLGPSGQPIWTDLGSYPQSRLDQLQTVYSFPSFRYGQGYGDIGIEKRYEGKDDLSWIRGKHAIKFGFDYSHIPFADDTVINIKGTFTFAKDQVFDPKNPATIAALTGPTQFTAALPPQTTSVPVSQYGVYVQDDWRVLPRLTLNVGLRWDREIGSYNEDLKASDFSAPVPFLGDPSKRGQTKNFGPRFGIAWNVRGNSRDVVRAGFGIYWSNIQTLNNFNENRNISQCNVLISNPPYPNAYGNKTPQDFCSSAPPTITVLDQHFSMPYASQFTGGYSHQFPHGISVSADGIYMHTLKDWRSFDVNYPNAAGVRPLPAYARILIREPISQYKYKALYVRAEKRLAGRYGFSVAYTLSDNRDDAPQSQITNQASYQQDWGNAGLDRRHAIVVSSSVVLPFKINLGAIWQYRTSLPFNATSTVQVDGITQFIPGLTRNLGNRDNDRVISAVNAWRATQSLGPLSASQIDSSRFTSFDILLARSFAVREQQRIEFRGQAFNLFGTQNLTGGSTGSGASANFGRILGAANLQQAELAVRYVF
jgi:hypothetical protein